MQLYTKSQLEQAAKTIASAVNKLQKILLKLKEGSSQRTLAQRRLEAFNTAISLIEEKLAAERTKLYPIILSKYNSEWAEWFQAEKALIEKRVGKKNIISLTHIGSTSVPGLAAKPTVDILMQIPKDADIEQLKKVFSKSEYVCIDKQTMPSNDIILVLKGYTDTGFADKVFHIHIRYQGNWDEVYFRNYLADHPDVAAQYAELKYALKNKYEYDRDSYTNAKGDFIRSVTMLAREEK